MREKGNIFTKNKRDLEKNYLQIINANDHS